jgi:hypothetical protein
MKYIIIVAFCSILDMSFHVMTSKISTIPNTSNFSILTKVIGVTQSAILWILIAFSSVAYVFYLYKNKLPGVNNTLKGLRYGSTISLLWLFGMIEGVSLVGNTLIHETVMGLCDAFPIIVMGLLLGKFTTERTAIKQKNNSFNPCTILLSVFIFSIVFLVGRYLFYFTRIIESGYETRPYSTFIWTFLMGLCIGVTYISLGKSTQSSSTILSSVKFGVTIFGINWSVFLVFMPIIYEGNLIKFIIRCTIDIILVILGYYISASLEKLITKKML